MLSKEVIKNLAQKKQTTELNIEREYFQHLFLSYFYEQKGAQKVYFKGGTALRIIHGSPRFSEDLDFSSRVRNIPEIEQMMVKTLEAVEKEGFNVDIEESKQTSGGYLANLYFDKVAVQLQISLRDSKKKGESVTIVSDFLPTYVLKQLSSEQLVEEKIRALLDRGKPLDFYYLYFILRANLLPVSQRIVLPKIIGALKKNVASFDKELKQFLPRNQWLIIRNFRSVLEREIGRFL